MGGPERTLDARHSMRALLREHARLLLRRWRLIRDAPLTMMGPFDDGATRLIGPLALADTRALQSVDSLTRRRDRRERAGRALRALWNRVAGHLRASADARALDAARRFHATLQWFVYCAAANDRTGRVAQMAAACPGLLSVASDLTPRSGIFRGIICGERLRHVLGRTVHTWAMQEDARDLHTGRRPLGERLEREPDLLGRQRLLLRRATAAVAPARLFRPPPLAFAPEDIPRDPTDNVRWYSRMKAPALLWPAPHLLARAHQGLCLLVSRHARAGDLAPGMGIAWDREMGEVCDYLALTGRVPTRRGNLPELLAASRRWHAQHVPPPPPPEPEPPVLLGPRNLQVPPPPKPAPPPPEPPFPAPPFDNWPPPGGSPEPDPAAPRRRSPPLIVRAIRAPRELEREGREMSHCVATYGHWIRSGQCAIYHVVAAGQQLTLEVVFQQGRWVVGDVKGFQNRNPSARAWRALQPWLEAHGLGSRRGH